MKPEEFINNAPSIYECAKSFRQDANGLMNGLAKEYNFSLEASEIFPEEVYHHKFNNKGSLSRDWIYFFHGAECKFENVKTKQAVELIYITKPEFGYLDGYFFYNYMNTTERFKELAAWFGNHINVWNAIETLADKGILARIHTVETKRNIIAL